MKIEIELQIKGLRCLKGLMQTLLKVFFDQKENVNIYLVYFCQSKQIRFLVNSEHCKAVLAIDPRVSISDKSTTKQDSQLLAIEFKEGDVFLKTFCQLVDKEGTEDVVVTLSKDKALENQQPFRSLNFINNNDKYRTQIFKPLYDPPLIMQHQWLSGCSSNDLKKVEFDFESEQLLSLLRLVYRHKETQAKEKMIYVNFNFKEGKVVASLEKLRHNSMGEMIQFNFMARKYEGNYLFSITPQQAGRIYELLIGKSSGRKFFINVSNCLIFCYYHQGVFESQVLVSEWIRFQKFQGVGNNRQPETKMQM